jgi:hypothetical protein
MYTQLRTGTGTCSTKDNGVESHNQSVGNFDDKASDNPDIPLGDNGSMNNTSDITVILCTTCTCN